MERTSSLVVLLTDRRAGTDCFSLLCPPHKGMLRLLQSTMSVQDLQILGDLGMNCFLLLPACLVPLQMHLVQVNGLYVDGCPCPTIYLSFVLCYSPCLSSTSSTFP